MDLEMLAFRARCLQTVRSFFVDRGYLETDTPALSARLIPETCLEVFKTEYRKPWKEGEGAAVPLYLVPSPEIYLKQIIADHGVSLFQISHCYRNAESVGRIHSPEFTMLEYYTVHADYTASLDLTEELFSFLLDALFPEGHEPAGLRPPFIRMTMDDAFRRFAGFPLCENPEPADLARHAARLGLGDEKTLSAWSWDDLYELILVHAIEPALPKDRPTALMDYPAAVPCLAAEKSETVALMNGRTLRWNTRERWELYAGGVELANCYTELRDTGHIRQYMENETREKNLHARVPHPAIADFETICARMPPCSGSAMGLDRLIMLLTGKTSLDSILPFPLTDNI